MKFLTLCSLLIVLAGFVSQPIFSQKVQFEGGGNYHRASQPCISPEQRETMVREMRQNLHALAKGGKYHPVRSADRVRFQWPVAQAPGFAYSNFYAISNYVDHDQEFSGDNNLNVSDYRCGSRSYDTGSGYNHQGTDIFPWPFDWNAQDQNQVFIVAAADGIITFKDDVHQDRSCGFVDNPPPWNAVFLSHEDGSITWYGHLKKGTTTPKSIGESVTAGEYLGVMGSSGFSSGPHLHFEVYDPEGNLIDPYPGECNTLNDSSYWIQEEPYRVPTLNTLLTHSNSPVFPNCPGERVSLSESNYASCFSPGDRVYLAAYYRDQPEGLSTQYSILRPDGTTYDSWSHSSPDTFSASWWFWSNVIPANEQQGRWTYRGEFNGQTVEHNFFWGLVTSGTPVADTLCTGDSISLQALPGTAYDWNTGQNTSSIAVGAIGSYSVSVTTGNQCRTQQFTIDAYPRPEVQIAGDTEFCEGSAALLSVVDEFAMYQWSDGSADQEITVTTEGSYSVTVTDVNGCTGSSAIEVIQSEAPEPVIEGESQLCPGESVTLSVQGGFNQYAWNSGSEASQISIDAPGEFCVTVTDGNGCTGQTCFIVEGAPELELITMGDTTLCPGESTVIGVVAEDSHVSYEWGGAGATATIPVNTAGSYAITVTDVNGCTASAVFNVVEVPVLAIESIEGPLESSIGDVDTFSVFPNMEGVEIIWEVTGGIIIGNSNNTTVYVEWTNSLAGQVCATPVYLDCQGISGCVEVDLMSTAVSGPQWSGDITIFPNPATQVVHVDLKTLNLNGRAVVRIFDLNGRVCTTTVIDNVRSTAVLSIPLTNVSDGLYVLELTAEPIIVYRRFIVAQD